MGMPRGPSGQWFQRAFTSSCILLIDRPPLPRAASHTTSHPTSYAIFATKSALSATAQLAKQWLSPNLEDDLLKMSLGNSITTILQQFLSKHGPKDSFQFSTLLHQAQCFHIITHSHQSPAPHTLSADTNRWRKLNFCTTTLALTVVQPIATLAAMLEAHFSSFKILFAKSPWKVSRLEISFSV